MLIEVYRSVIQLKDTCFLFGHRTAEDRLLPEIESEAERLRSEYGIHEFIIGNYGDLIGLLRRRLSI